ncbi:long-chain fatty acid--CoA ligase [Natronomonas sp.]|uniref:long-chain fatty acid--CoA ligase n=1 Tax=Natronomonas sp. TaxID=2184060 RepID=UPI003988DC30
MQTQLTLDTVIDRAGSLFPDREIVTKTLDGSQHRYTYADAHERICQLAHALDELGLDRGDRVASVAMNNYRHFELYFGPACSGRSLHMCNPRLPDDHFQYIINDAEDSVVFLDPAFIEKVAQNASEFESVEQFVVLAEEVPDGTPLEPVIAYEDLLADQPTEYEWPDLDEEEECGMCYTSGTTGKPKGVEYSHRGVYLHTMAAGFSDGIGIKGSDTVMPVVPMFHANGWGLPYAATYFGAEQVFPGVHMEPEPLARLIDEENVTMSGAVPTLWLGMSEFLDANPEVDISSIDRLMVGGSAPPKSLIRTFDEEYDAPILQGWGMTEMSPLGSVSTLRKELEEKDPDERYEFYAKAGMPVPGVQTRIRDEDGNEVPRDGEEFGELEVRGPWIADRYHNRPEATAESFTDDGWFKTGDIVTMDEWGYIDIVDRNKDVIKSGGEWISSVDLENELMAHEAVSEATVIAVDHERWQERPMACIVPREDEDVTVDSLEEHLSDSFPSWWLPDNYEFLEEIPKTSTEKFDKKVLRERFDDVVLTTETEAGQ